MSWVRIPATLRAGLEKSRNLMTVRLAQAVGMDVAVSQAAHLEHWRPVVADATAETLLQPVPAADWVL